MSNATVSNKGARRWAAGHPWIFRSDVIAPPDDEPGVARVTDPGGKPLGVALWSPRSEISLRLLDRDAEAIIDRAWWRRTLERAIARRSELKRSTNAFRLVHGEGDLIPSLVVDRYDRWLVVQLMSAGLERFRADIIAALNELVEPEGILARNDVSLRRNEGLDTTVELLAGSVPDEIEVNEHGVRYLAAPWRGQKTGAFLDQRDNRALAGSVARGRALDCFSHHGSFALHLARRAEHVVALDASAHALVRAQGNFRRNALANGEFVEANAFEYFKARQRERTRLGTILVGPPT